VAASTAQAAGLWKLREGISEAQKREGASIKHDISVPVAAIPDFLAKAVPAVLAIAPGARPVSFGHLGRRQPAFQFQFASGRAMIPAFLALWEEVQQTVHDIVKEFAARSAPSMASGHEGEQLPRYKSHEELDACAR
jgi:FAD/FMN-containing dehydrogenase